jgi:subtilisin
LVVVAATVSLLTGLVSVPAFGASGRGVGEEHVKVIVDFEHQPALADAHRLRALGASIRFRYRSLPAIAMTLPVSMIDAVRRQPGVRNVELDHKLTPFESAVATADPELDRSWGVKHIGAGRVHLAGNHGEGIRVAVIDTGIDCSHPDLNANCDAGISYIASAPFPNGVPFDDMGHGTHVAGIIAAEQSTDSAGVVGVAPSARLVAFKVLDSSGSGDYSGLIAALDQIATWNTDAAPANDIRVVNISLGGTDPSDALQAAVTAANASGAIIVAASGNVDPFDFQQLIYGCPVAYPGRYSEVMATTFTDVNDALTGYSCTGPEVDFASPGDEVYSTLPTSGPLSDPSGYGALSGTSMASPHLAGSVALLLANGITDTNGDGLLQDEVKAHLCATASQAFGVTSTPIPPGDPRYPLYFGCGVVDIGAAVVDSPPEGGNAPPSASAGGPYAGNEGAAIVLTGVAHDPEGDALTTAWSWTPGAGVDASATCSVADPADRTTTMTCTDDGTWSVRLTVDDGTHPAVHDAATLTVANLRPTVTITSLASGSTVMVGTNVSLATTVADPGANDTATCTIRWGDGTTSPGCSGSHVYAAVSPALSILVKATDDDGSSDSDSVAVIVVPATLVFTPVADAYVRASSPTTNFGPSTILRVRNGTVRTYVRFNVSGLATGVVGAKLRLFVTDPSSAGGTAFTVPSTPWKESTVTWASAPALGQQLSTVGTAATGKWVTFDLGSAVTGNGLYTFAITNGSSDAVDFESREGVHDPRLVLTLP